MSEPQVVETQLDTAVEIYLDGYTAGIEAALEMCVPGQLELVRDSVTEDMVRAVTTDPAFLAAVRAAVRERLGMEDLMKAAADALDADLADVVDIDAGLREVLGGDR